MRAVDILIKRRDRGELSRVEIEFFIKGLASGEIADYQAAAWAMAVFFNGMTTRETADLAMAMVHSGKTLDLSDTVPFNEPGGRLWNYPNQGIVILPPT